MRSVFLTNSVLPDSEADDRTGSSHIVELSANDITVHQSSEEEDNEENRKTASLGDLSLARPVAPSLGTLERAQSLEMSENTQISIHPAAPPKKRKGLPVSDSDLSEKEPRLMMVTDLDGMDQQQHRGRLRSANEWGNLEDAISGKSSAENMSSDTESSGRVEGGRDDSEDHSKDVSLVTEVMAVLNSAAEQQEKKIVAEIKEHTVKMIEEIPVKTMEQLLKEKLEEAKAALETDEEDEVVEEVKRKVEENKNGFTETVTITTTTTTKMNGTPAAVFALKEEIDLAAVTPPESLKMADLSPNDRDDIKVSKFPFGSLERPKSDVLKKVIARKMDYTTAQMIAEAQPVSLTLIGGANEDNSKMSMDQDTTPIYSSDNKGVNSINISSMEVNMGPVTRQLSGNTCVTISSDRSQPSSIILIEDEKLDFTMRTPPSEMVAEAKVPPQPAVRSVTSGQVFIVDRLSQPKVVRNGETETVVEIAEGESQQLSDQDVIDALKTFVTEIDVTNSGINDRDANAEVEKVDMEREERMRSELALRSTEMFLENERQMASSMPRVMEMMTSALPPVAPLPRNTEIKFTTSTYESSPSKINGGAGERRHSAHVDQIRSTFERNSSNSEIPVPVRKSSIPTLKLSPSKIPVFNTNGGSASGAVTTTMQRSSSVDRDRETSPTNTQRFSRKSPSPTGGNRERSSSAVTLTSIKNSARHPSGK